MKDIMVVVALKLSTMLPGRECSRIGEILTMKNHNRVASYELRSVFSL